MTTKTVYLLLAVKSFLACLMAAQTTNQCSTGIPAIESFQPRSDLDYLAAESVSGVQVIAPGMRFSCHGRITEWSLLTSFSSLFDGLLHRVDLQVWRPSPDFEGKFDLIGSNTLKYEPRGSPANITAQVNSSFAFFSISGARVDAEEQIHFQPGDVLGWFIPRLFRLNRGFNVVFENTTSTGSSNSESTDLYSMFSSTTLCEMYTCSDRVLLRSSTIPLIRPEYAIVDPPPTINSTNLTCGSQPFPSSCEVTTVSPTTPPTPTIPIVTTGNDMILYVVAGVVPGGLLIIMFVIAGVVMMCVGFRVNVNCCPCLRKFKREHHTNPTYASPDDFIHLNQPLSKPSPHNGGMFYTNTSNSPIPNTPVGFSEDVSNDMFDGQNYASTYQANGKCHIYQELCRTPEPVVPPPLPRRSSLMSSGSMKATRSSARFSVQSISQFPYTMPNTPAPSYPYLEAVPTMQTSGLPPTPQESPPSSASEVSKEGMTMRKLFHALDDEGFRVPTAEEREMYDGTQVEELYSKLHRPHSYTRSRDSRDTTFFEQSDIYWEPSYSSAELFNQLAKRKYREIKRSHIRIQETLGGGHFSSVHRGVWEVPGGNVEVAVKTLKPNLPETDKVKFLQEAAIMGQFLHPNVAKLQGVVTIGEPVMIVLELMPNGDLKNYVRSLRSKPKPQDLPNLFLRFCREVAFGMNYLSNKGYVHRDLAARNILLTEDLTCKIGDFGMARDLDVDNIYQSQGGKIPLKWTAPEGLKHRQYSSASDVWSYGMLLFEIWTLGRKPYEGASTDELMNFMETFHCQPPPPGTPREMYRLMVQCWHPVPSERPRFSEICTYLHSTDEVLLNWNNADKAVGPRVTEIGGPLSEGSNLYLDLQNMYSLSRNDTGSTGSITVV